MAQSGNNVPVRTTDEGAAEIKRQVRNCLNSERGREGITEGMVAFCLDYVEPMLSNFAAANRGGATQKTIVIDKVVRDGGQSAEWVKDCQIVVEVDADQANAKIKQNGHIGCEIYFANKEKCVGKHMEEQVARAGRRIFKMHAYLPNGENPPHYRHEPESEDSARIHAASKIESKGDVTILYRCKVIRKGCSQKRGEVASILVY